MTRGFARTVTRSVTAAAGATIALAALLSLGAAAAGPPLGVVGISASSINGVPPNDVRTLTAPGVSLSAVAHSSPGGSASASAFAFGSSGSGSGFAEAHSFSGVP